MKRVAAAVGFDAPGPRGAALDEAKGQPLVVIDPYSIDVVLEEGVAVPTSYRERVRALGPTIHPDMGKQGEGGAAVEVMRAHSGGARSTGRLGLIRLKK